jgi:hypothetical protein
MARAGSAYRADPTPERLAAYVRSIETVASDQRELVAFVVAVDPADALAEFEREVEGSRPRG